MPYIENKQLRQSLNEAITLNIDFLRSKGALNYFLCKLFLEMYNIDYEHARNFIGELENAKLEIYRRWISKYEDIKCKENGDV